ncbi:transcription antitermination factor NusB [Mesomycoplasma lagogenitalium]|uniref:Transcription antitermination factor NusB n=1 Tax=Mesomycoplasma lagogenitalium TaxID=171286 RepID=A0ABY8LSN4_9BACT|nr:transcription antitermination factor NusB [Mesomycoplasma lagogenitalium]WGI36277.1 transcription antitermination factor NusB [Mesomycoplasma lagogenitalium]
MNNQKNRKKYRYEIISILYQYELFNEIINSKEVFEKHELSSQQLKTIEFIEKYYIFLKKVICLFLKKDWNENLPLIRAILLLGSFELLYIDKKIVINEFVEITKDYTMEKDVDYKLVNAILEKVDKEYEKNNHKKSN